MLYGNGTYSGGTTISAGTIELGSSTALGTGTVTLNDTNTGSNNTALLDDLSGAIIANNIVVANQGTGTTTIGSNMGLTDPTFTGTLTLNRATTLQGENPEGTSYTGVISGSVGTSAITGGEPTILANPANSFSGNIQITGSGTTLQSGDGPLLGFGGNGSG